MSRLRQITFLILVLLACSLGVFWLQNELFHDSKDAVFYLLQDLGFLPLQVLLVSLVINELLSRREKEARLHKMNMAIGAFYQEIGTPLLSQLAGFDGRAADLGRHLLVNTGWNDADFQRALKAVENHDFQVGWRPDRAGRLKKFLLNKREALLAPLENSNLLEHEDFSDLLWAVNHLADELFYRKNIRQSSATDRKHLEGDVRRALKPLFALWLVYARHLKKDYPYIFSLVIRTNPFDKDAKVELK